MFATIKYSGLITKSRALSARLLTPEDYYRIISMDSVVEAIAYLREHPGYKDIFRYADDDISHRGQLEHILAYSLYRDYLKLYRFADAKGREFLAFLEKRIELTLIKSSLRAIYTREALPRYTDMLNYLDRHCNLKLENLYNADNPASFVNALKRTIYYPELSKLDLQAKDIIFMIESALDRSYFRYIWENKEKCLSKQDAETLTEIFGTETDLLNIMWIYRCKRYFALSSSYLYGMVIPYFHKLKKSQLNALIECNNVEEFAVLIKKTAYDTPRSPFDMIHPEMTFNKKMDEAYRNAVKQSPVSMSVIASFLYERTRELDTLTTAIECVRYSLPADEIRSYLLRCKPDLAL